MPECSPGVAGRRAVDRDSVGNANRAPKPRAVPSLDKEVDGQPILELAEPGRGAMTPETCPNCGAELIIELAAESAAEHQAMPEDLRGQIGAAMGQQGA